MAEIKWIKLSTSVFDDEKFDAINTLADRNEIQLAWVKLLCLAGTCNENGFLMLNREIPYTIEMLASRFRMDIGTVQRAMAIFQQLEMIEVVDDIYMVSNWLKYQSGDRLEDIRKKDRERQAAYRAKQKKLKIGQKCAYCGADADSTDHIIPKTKGGTSNEDNLVPCCKQCNSTKNNRDLDVFLNEDLKYSNRLNHELIRSNEKLMKYVEYKEDVSQYVTVTVTGFCSNSYSLYSISNNNTNNLKSILSIDSDYKDKDYYLDNDDLVNSIKEWMEYKDERTPKKANHYTERGMKSFLTEVKNHCLEYGEKAVIETINHTIANQWQGIFWDWLEKKYHKLEKQEQVQKGDKVYE